MGHGFREIIIDQHFSGKWTEVDMNLGGGHGTFQGTKFTDSAGGYSYRCSESSPKHFVQNRFIYWRVLNEMLELTESSTDHNLEDSQVRIVFPDSPIVSPISIHETETNVIILVVTVTSVNRFIFNHPNKTLNEEPKARGNKHPSIFQQASLKPIMNFNSFSLFEHAINIPVPITAASHVMPSNGGYIFALSYDSGGVTICTLTKDDSLCLYDLRQANMFVRLLSFTPSILRAGARNSVSPDAAVGLSFFTAKIQPQCRRALFLVTLSMNGHLRLYACSNPQTAEGWTVVSDILVDKMFAGGYTDSTMMLRTYHENPKEYPKFVIFVPGEGFKVYQCLRDGRGPTPPKLILNETTNIISKEKTILDFCVTDHFLFTLISNPDEETDWEAKSFDLTQENHARFNLALLEPPPQPEPFVNTTNTEPKEFYSNLIFNKCSFSASTIYNALSMFKNSNRFPRSESDWDLTKLYALRVIESEIREITADSDEPVADNDIYELTLKYWGEFYTSCVEHHINTLKPLGIFYESSTKLVCIVKKSRMSFLRPTDFLETIFYFPHFMVAPTDSESARRATSFLKYFEIMDLLESSVDEPHKFKIEKRIREHKQTSEGIWTELANLIVEADPHSEVVERRHFLAMIRTKLRELGDVGTEILRYIVHLLSSWDMVVDGVEEPGIGMMEVDSDENETPERVTQFFMGGKLGANITYRIVKQLVYHRFMLVRNTLLLQALVNKFTSQTDTERQEPIEICTTFEDQRTAHSTLLRCFSLLALLERPAEFVHENWSENALKVANLLNCRTTEQIVHGKIPDFWPIKLVEFFCNSAVGGLAIRSRMTQMKKPLVMAYADAAGRAIWPAEESVEYAFEDFLIGAGQFNALAYYATDLAHHSHSQDEQAILGPYYHGISDFFVRNAEAALFRFLSISVEDLEDAPYFCGKILGAQGQFPKVFFEKVINLFQIFGYTQGVQRLAESALAVIRDERWILIMSVLGFKSSLSLGDYESAFKFIEQMPNTSVGGNGQIIPGKQRASSIQTFITRLLEKKDIEVLVGLHTNLISDTIRGEVEKVLHAQAKLSDPLAEDSVYQMVYFHHLCRKNFEKAAIAMLERVTQVGLKGKGRAALEIQRDAYLDVLSCLSLVNGNTKSGQIIGQGDEVGECLLTLQNNPVSNTAAASVLTDDHFEIKYRLRSYEKILRECELCISLLLLKDDKEVSPIKYSLERERAEACVSSLLQIHQYDQAVKLAGMWGLSYQDIISSFTKMCVNLVYNVKPASGDPADYIRHLQLSELPNSNAKVHDLAFLILRNYVFKLEKSKETKLHKEVSLVLLRYNINLPLWLLDSYKKRDANQLILCFMRYGDWEEATTIALEVIDAALGRRDSKNYDPSIQTVTALQPIPIIPYNTIEELANQMNQIVDEKPHLQEVLENLKERCDDFVLRVLETRQEQRLMFAA